MELKDAYKKAFENVVERLKENGTVVVKEGLEDAATLLYKELKAGLIEGATLSSTPIDNIVISFMPTLDLIVDPAIEDINKADNVTA